MCQLAETEECTEKDRQGWEKKTIKKNLTLNTRTHNIYTAYNREMRKDLAGLCCTHPHTHTVCVHMNKKVQSVQRNFSWMFSSHLFVLKRQPESWNHHRCAEHKRRGQRSEKQSFGRNVAEENFGPPALQRNTVGVGWKDDRYLSSARCIINRLVPHIPELKMRWQRKAVKGWIMKYFMG